MICGVLDCCNNGKKNLHGRKVADKLSIIVRTLTLRYPLYRSIRFRRILPHN